MKKWAEVITKKSSVEDVSAQVRAMANDLKEKHSTDKPSESILVFPFPKQIEGGDDHTELTGIACELTIGPEVYLTSEQTPKSLSEPGVGSASTESFFSIKPGDFAVLTTYEYVYLPITIMGLLSVRNSYKQRGLINVSGFHVDPGFHGRLLFTVYNAGPGSIVLRFRDPVFMLIFADVKEATDPYEYRTIKAQEFKNGKDQLKISSESLGSLQGRSVSPRSLDDRLRKIETIVNILFIPLTTALIIALITLIVKG